METSKNRKSDKFHTPTLKLCVSKTIPQTNSRELRSSRFFLWYLNLDTDTARSKTTTKSSTKFWFFEVAGHGKIRPKKPPVYPRARITLEQNSYTSHFDCQVFSSGHDPLSRSRIHSFHQLCPFANFETHSPTTRSILQRQFPVPYGCRPFG